MKRFLTIILATFMLCACAGCSGGGIDSNVESASNSTDKTDDNGNGIPEALKRKNEISYYTSDEVKKIIKENTKFDISEDFESFVPKSVSYLSYFDYAPVNRPNISDFYTDFKEMFAYLFPDEKFNDDYFFYYYIRTDEETENAKEDEYPIKNVKKYFDEAADGKRKISYYFYSPYSHFAEKEGTDYAHRVEKDSLDINDRNIFLEFGPPIGNYLSNVNKGVLAEYYSKEKGEKNDYWLEVTGTVICEEYETVRSCTPDCTDKYRLLDGKEISVADAVTFFEKYMNDLPCPKDPVYDTKVTGVNVKKLGEDKYFFMFQITPTYAGVPLDWGRFRLTSESELRTITGFYGTMAVTDDIDSFVGYVRAASITDEKVTEELLPFDKAISKIEQSLTEQVSFEVLSADLVYEQMTYYGAYDIPLEEQKRETSPAWKVVIQNKNNDLVYTCYIDADTGDNFSYSKAAFYTETEEAEG